MTFVTLWIPAPPTAAAAVPDTAASPHTPAGRLLARLPSLTPHALATPAPGGTLVWADGRGLPARSLAQAVLRLAREAGLAAPEYGEPRVGIARVAVAAAVAARWGARWGARQAGRVAPSGTAAPITAVAAGAERAFLAAHPLTVVLPAASGAATGAVTPVAVARTVAALADVGVVTCGELARVAAAAVEVRFGAAGVALWRLARADDPRRIFRHAARDRPSASLEWTEFALREPERLTFVANGLVGQLCDALATSGEVAGTLTMTFALVGGGHVERRVRAAHGTADPAAWRRLVRADLGRVTLPDAVCGLALRIEAARTATAPQSDLFDRGAGTAAAALAAVARLVEDGAGAVVLPVASAHPLPERRLAWHPTTVAAALRPRTLTSPAADRVAAPPPLLERRARPQLVLSPAPPPLTTSAAGPCATTAPPPLTLHSGTERLALRILPVPRPLAVTTRAERGHLVPVRYRERLGEGARARRGQPLLEVLTAVGPDRIATGREEGAPVAREYWQCFTERGELVLVYRALAPAPESGASASGAAAEQGSRDAWFLHGWWD